MRLIEKLTKIKENTNEHKIRKPKLKKTKNRLKVSDLIIVLGMAYALKQSKRNEKRRAIEAVKKVKAYNALFENSQNNKSR